TKRWAADGKRARTRDARRARRPKAHCAAAGNPTRRNALRLLRPTFDLRPIGPAIQTAVVGEVGVHRFTCVVYVAHAGMIVAVEIVHGDILRRIRAGHRLAPETSAVMAQQVLDALEE